MGGMFSDSLFIPAMVLALFGWLVPRILSLWFPEGIKPLLILGCISALVMLVLSMIGFTVLYIVQGVPLRDLFSGGFIEVVSHFALLGVVSGLLWGPIMILSVAALPRTWVGETW